MMQNVSVCTVGRPNDSLNDSLTIPIAIWRLKFVPPDNERPQILLIEKSLLYGVQRRVF